MLYKIFLNQIFSFNIQTPFIGSLIGGALGYFGASAAGASTATAIGAAGVGAQIGGASDANSARASATRSTNALNYELFQQQKDFNSAEAEKQRKWQQRMSQRAVRRQVYDMRQAGINPILAAQYGGASSGSGATAHAAQPNMNVPGIENIMAGATSTANDWRATSSMVGLQQNQIQKIQAETEYVMADTQFKNATTQLTNDQRGKIAQEIGKMRAEIKLIIARTTGQNQFNQIKQVLVDFINSGDMHKLAQESATGINMILQALKGGFGGIGTAAGQIETNLNHIKDKITIKNGMSYQGSKTQQIINSIIDSFK